MCFKNVKTSVKSVATGYRDAELTAEGVKEVVWGGVWGCPLPFSRLGSVVRMSSPSGGLRGPSAARPKTGFGAFKAWKNASVRPNKRLLCCYRPNCCKYKCIYACAGKLQPIHFICCAKHSSKEKTMTKIVTTVWWQTLEALAALRDGQVQINCVVDMMRTNYVHPTHVCILLQ